MQTYEISDGTVKRAISAASSRLWGARSLLAPVTCAGRRPMPSGMMITRVCPPALPDLRPALRLAGPARPVNGVQDIELLVLGTRSAYCAVPVPGHGRTGAGRAVLATLIRLLPRGLQVRRLVTPGSVLRWHRRLVTTKRAYPHRTGRPPVSAETAALTGRLATGNHGRGYQRIQGEVLKPGYRVSASTIRRVLKAPKIPPAPERHTGATWRQFPHAQAATKLAAGFYHADRAVTLRRLHLWVPKTGATWADALGTPSASRTVPGGQSGSGWRAMIFGLWA